MWVVKWPPLPRGQAEEEQEGEVKLLYLRCHFSTPIFHLNKPDLRWEVCSGDIKELSAVSVEKKLVQKPTFTERLAKQTWGIRLRPRLHEQIKHTLFAQIRPELLHTDREFEQLKEVLFAHENAAQGYLKKGPEFVSLT